MLKITFAEIPASAKGALILTVADRGTLGKQGAKLDKKTGGLLSKAMKASHFTGKKEQTLTLLAPAKLEASRLVLVGIGDTTEATATTFEKAGAASLAALNGKETEATLIVDTFETLGTSEAEAAAHAAFGARLRTYRFDKYRTTQKPEDKPALKTLTVALNGEPKAAKALYAPLEKIADGVFFARDLVSEPANKLTPDAYAQQLVALTKLGIKVDILDEKKMHKLGMGSLLGVGQGSQHPPRLVSLEWKGAPSAKDKAPVCFVGKGVTFDSGGISLKPGSGMEKMKYDMSGSAAVVGALKALAGRKAKANVVGIIGLVENMPSGNALKPSDVITSGSGQTIEVINTDAEGRLVLADALWYAQKTFKPRCIIDIATLTGAMAIALGNAYAGIFSNNDSLAEQLTKAGKTVDEKLWRFPMGKTYDKQLDSAVADMKNMGDGRGAGSIVAAQFLKRFVKEGTPWTHIDIAGVAWQDKESPTSTKGATAFGVRLCDRLVADVFETQ